MLRYDSRVSGNCRKVRLLHADLRRDCERRELDVVDGSNRIEVLGERSEAGFDLGRRPAILAWLARLKEQAGHFPIDA